MNWWQNQEYKCKLLAFNSVHWPFLTFLKVGPEGDQLLLSVRTICSSSSVLSQEGSDSPDHWERSLVMGLNPISAFQLWCKLMVITLPLWASINLIGFKIMLFCLLHSLVCILEQAGWKGTFLASYTTAWTIAHMGACINLIFLQGCCPLCCSFWG